METVYRAQHSIDAHVIRGLLESRGVDAYVTGEFLQGGAGGLPAFGMVEVKVAAADAALAREIIRAVHDDTGAELEA